MRRTVGVLAALAMAAAVFAAPGPASAGGPVQEKYVAVNPNGSSVVGWFWIDELEGIIGCAKCIWLIDLAKSHELPTADEAIVQQNLMDGLTKLSEAKIADPRTAAYLRSQAVDRFMVAARALGSASVRPGVIGYYDPDKRAKIASHRDWLAAADQDLADGLSLLQRAIEDPSPQPWITAAVAEFDEAYGELAAKRAIG